MYMKDFLYQKEIKETNSQVIPGFSEALLTMNVGSVIRTWIHPDLGYGANGTEAILPNSLLVFDIELVGIDN